ncbi:MAG TPA: hypothetical protein VMA95_07755 [Streptosporangiaceae bacterium]|nr:hypothetical protein [Streptosporangiaceae bacterium]
MTARRALLAVGTVGAGSVMLVAGCSSSTTTSSAKPPSTPSASASGVSQAACVHIKSLRTSLTHLTTVKVSGSSAGQLTSDLTNIQKQLAALKGQDLGSFSGQATQLNSSLDQIKKSSAQLSTNPTGAAKSLSKELTGLKTKAGPVIAQSKTVCKGSG